ncbi:LacI family DNA-binding transcriptional regulator [Methylobacterium sp.]|jgi:LacI family transcriptional regulator|uniref:LacI family DNA-binding transcriptional regulator n=1 Tax=Methylobacterium sp. TaxID=409 RepID=UPI000C3FEE8B|nr:LacI family DNA-binding transcriptional regulator [Methylobacterium sp.]MBP33513.1 sugar-binding protein [Methylobacterium sp.]
MSERRATIVTVAEAAGVAPSTISRALKGDKRISPETRARIARVASELGYTPYASARALASGQSGLIGVVVGPITNPFYTQLLYEAVRQIGERGMRLLVIHAGPGPLENSMADALLQYQVDGCLISSVDLPSHVGAVCAANAVPVVMVNRVAQADTCAVVCDNEFGSVQLGELLLRRGRRRTALVRTSTPSSTARERDAGFTTFMQAAGHPPVLRLDGQSCYEGGFAAGQQIAALTTAERPDSVYAVSDIMAYGVLDALRLAGIAVGRDIAVVGFDGLPQSARPIYNLTTVEQPIGPMISRALDLLQARMRDRTLPDETISLRGRLIERGSSRSIP